MQQHHLARWVFEAIDHRVDDAEGLRAAHQIVSTYLAEVETAGQVGGIESADIEAEIAIGLRQLRDGLLAGQQARTGSTAIAVGEIIARIAALVQGLARRAMAQRPAPVSGQYKAVSAAPGSPWLQVDLPMRARVWSALGEIRQARQARAAGVHVVCILPDTLQFGEVEAWLRWHDMLSDAWMQMIVEGR